ncbi:hypothetical protein [Streptomyces sp. NPDC057336]|uniref:hypothetical protein n=1 Tax=Streptomyces sp. NPDC057336 TaxID=3346102 RepID=UPI00363FC537
MSLKLRRAAVVSLAALALTAGGAVSAAGAAEASAAAVAALGPDGGGHGSRGGHEPPLHFGPFELPKFGSVSGGFSWGLAR